jgi:hypothetical protein
LLKIQVTIVYFFSAVAKITPQYLAGEILTRSLKQEGWLAVPESWRTPATVSLLAVTSIVVELFIAFGLWSPRLRLSAIIAGTGFHVLIIAVLDSSRLSLAIFALEMFAVYLLFVDAGRHGRHRWLAKPPWSLVANRLLPRKLRADCAAERKVRCVAPIEAEMRDVAAPVSQGGATYAAARSRLVRGAGFDRLKEGGRFQHVDGDGDFRSDERFLLGGFGGLRCYGIRVLDSINHLVQISWLRK